MSRVQAALGSGLFLFAAPGVMAGLVPWLLTGWGSTDPPMAVAAGCAILIVAGAAVVLLAFARFVLEGRGTPAPIAPTDTLVVGGLYRYVRNPMYVAVTALIIGQGLLFGSVAVLEYGAIVWAAFFVFVLGYEEPVLGEQFPEEYKRYRGNVRRWIPRITPWRRDH